MMCAFEDYGPGPPFAKRCAVCGRLTNPTTYPPHRVHARCKVKGLGDYVAASLTMFGITPARVTAAKRAIGLKKPCRCNQRQEALNQAGEKIRQRLSRSPVDPA